jgi:hypothetical protein
MPIVVSGVHGGVNTGLYDRYLNDERRPVRVDLRRRMVKIQNRVIQTCPRRTGRLVSTVQTTAGLDGERPYQELTIGKDGETDYLGYILNGTPAHLIFPIQNRPNPHLRFVSRGGMVVFARMVRHPGTRANNFLTRALDEGKG